MLVDHVTKRYESRGGTVDAVEDVTFGVGHGEVVSLVGPSGCGKSTVLKMVAGLVIPSAGRVDVGGTPAVAGRRDCGIMLQSPVLLPWRTVLENVLLPVEIFRLNRRKAEAHAQELLELVGLGGFERKYGWELSGGMQQRASLARLLVLDPEILLMDEPFAALDEFTRERLNFELLGLHHRLRRTIIYVTHNILEAVLLSDTVIAMTPRPGRVLAALQVELPRPRTREMVDSPTTVHLVSEIRRSLYDVRGAGES